MDGSPLLDLRGHFVNGEAIREWASTIAKILWVIQYTINYGPIHEWESVFAKLLRVIKYIVNYGPIPEWTSNLCKHRVHCSDFIRPSR